MGPGVQHSRELGIEEEGRVPFQLLNQSTYPETGGMTEVCQWEQLLHASS